MRISEIEEAMFGTNPKRPSRNGSRPNRGHKTEPRYQSKVDEVSKPTLSNYVKAAGKDMVDRASGDSFKSGKAGDTYNKADATHKDTRREKGIDRALRKLSK
jgi:hypothetical protein